MPNLRLLQCKCELKAAKTGRNDFAELEAAWDGLSTGAIPQKQRAAWQMPLGS